ncbi:MAG: flagellar protein FlaG [Pseudomonadota bacterium]
MTTEITSQFAPLLPPGVSVTERPAVGEVASINSAPTVSGDTIGASSSEAAEGKNPGTEVFPTIGERPSTEDSLSGVVKNLNDLVQVVHHELKFSLDDEADRMVVQVIDSETDEVIRQIPSDEILALVKHLAESRQGGLLTEQA